MAAGFAAGALAALAMPPLFWLPFAVLGIAAFVWLWGSAPTPRSALMRGWAWGFGHFAVGSYWILEAFFVPPADFALLAPPMVFGLAALLGFFPALAAGVARALALRWPILAGRYRRLLLLALCWAIAEWLRGHVFTGHPWNPLGHVWAFATPLLQGAAVVGVYGLGAFTFLLLAAPVAGWRASVAALGIVGLAGIGGQAIMNNANQASGGPLLRIVQPNIPQAEKWRPESRGRQLTTLIELSRREGFDKLAAVIWPETAVPFALAPTSPLLATLASAAPPGGYLLTGVPRASGGRGGEVWNSLIAVDNDGRIVAHYDKVHLVPFGEYIPFHKELPPISGLIGRGSFEAGEAFMTLALPNLPPFSPLICYEVIFPAAVTATGRRPQWLLNITNDAWFGVSSGPYQHLTSARLRTIEEGLPMIRAANTGVSAVIDAYGTVLASLDMEVQGTIDHALPPARAATLYSRWGDGMLLLVVLLLAAGAALGRPLNRTSVT